MTKSLKGHLGWENNNSSGIVMCKALPRKGLHTFHGMIGYKMKDNGHNVTANDNVLRREELALHG